MSNSVTIPNMKLEGFTKIAQSFQKDINNPNNIILCSVNELKTFLPINLKTKGKKEHLDKLNNEIDEQTFIDFLMYQTHGGDYRNFEYLIYYYKLMLNPQTHMIMFTNEFEYISIKKEALYSWWVINILEKHPMYSKYMDSLMTFSTQKRLEKGVINGKENYKYDGCLDKLDIAFECNEAHHEDDSEKIKDSEKMSLAKFHGKALISLVTNNVVNVKKIKAHLYQSILRDDNRYRKEIIDLVLDHIDDASITTHYKLIDVKLNAIVRDILKYEYTNKILPLLSRFNRLSIKTKQIISNAIANTLETWITDIIHDSINTSTYLVEFRDELYDKVLCSALKHYEFRQDYIIIVFKETLVDTLTEDINYLEYIINNRSVYTDEAYRNAVKNKTNRIIFLKTVLDKFILTSVDFDKLYEVKTNSLKDPNNTFIISFVMLISIFKLTNDTELKLFRACLNITCNIHPTVHNNNVYISWLQLAHLLEQYDKNPELCSFLHLYYQMLDTMYENIIARIKAHDLSIISTPNDYYKYMHRIQKKEVCKYEKIITQVGKLNISLVNKTKITNIVNNNTMLLHTVDLTDSSSDSSTDDSSDNEDSLNDERPNITYDASDILTITESKNYNMTDAEKISRTNINERVIALYTKFNNLIDSKEIKKEVQATEAESNIILIVDESLIESSAESAAESDNDFE